MTVGVIPKLSVATKKPRVVVYLDESLKDLLEALADKRNRSVSNLLETLAKQEVEQAKVSGELNSRSAYQQRMSDPHRPSPSFEEERRLIGDDNPTNPYTPPGSITPRGGKR